MKLQGIALAMVAAIIAIAGARNAIALPSDLEEFDKARGVVQRHRADLMKISHVKDVTAAWNTDGETFISVDVDDPANVADVERQVPSQLEGFWVEVGSYAIIGTLRGHGRNATPSSRPTRSSSIDAQSHQHRARVKSATPAATP